MGLSRVASLGHRRRHWRRNCRWKRTSWRGFWEWNLCRLISLSTWTQASTRTTSKKTSRTSATSSRTKRRAWMTTRPRRSPRPSSASSGAFWRTMSRIRWVMAPRMAPRLDAHRFWTPMIRVIYLDSLCGNSRIKGEWVRIRRFRCMGLILFRFWTQIPPTLLRSKIKISWVSNQWMEVKIFLRVVVRISKIR